MTAPLLPRRGTPPPSGTQPYWLRRLMMLASGLVVQALGLLLVLSALHATDAAGHLHVGARRFVVGGLLFSLGFVVMPRFEARRPA